jgi:uncharacterized protein (TIGR02246 family)
VRLASLLLAIAATAFAFASEDGRAENERAVRETLTNFVRIWNQNEMKSFASLFAEDASFVVISGLHLTGRDEIAGYHLKLREGPYGDSHLAFNPVRIRFIRPDVAVAEVATEMTFNNNKRTSFATIVLVWENSRWLITAFENVLVSGPPVQPPSK